MLRPLTALRFIFALMVFFAHCVFFIPGGETAHPDLYGLFYEGFVGVNFFFILSGFILAYRYADGLQAASIPLRTFWLRRWIRIYPAYLLCLGLTAILHFQYLHQHPGAYFRDLALHVTMTQTLFAGGKHAFTLNGPAWSVANEMVFYLFFPLLIRLAKHPRLWRPIVALSLGLVIAGMLWVSQPADTGIFYSNPFVRMVDFMLGIALFQFYQTRGQQAWTKKRGNRMEVASILLLLICISLRNQVPLVWRYSVFYWVPTLLLIYTFAKGAGIISGLLSRNGAVLLGEASYAFYLFHTPAAIIVLSAFRHLGVMPQAGVFIAIYFIVTLCGSLVIFKGFERPATKRLRRQLIARHHGN